MKGHLLLSTKTPHIMRLLFLDIMVQNKLSPTLRAAAQGKWAPIQPQCQLRPGHADSLSFPTWSLIRMLYIRYTFLSCLPTDETDKDPAKCSKPTRESAPRLLT